MNKLYNEWTPVVIAAFTLLLLIYLMLKLGVMAGILFFTGGLITLRFMLAFWH